MILKVQDGAGGWILLDKVDQVHLRASGLRVSTRDEANALLVGLAVSQEVNMIAKECFKGSPLQVGLVEFHRGGKAVSGVFVDTIFVCSDSGDTVDRLESIPRQTRQRGAVR